MKNKMHDEYILCSLYIGVENGEGVGGLSQPPFFAQIPHPLTLMQYLNLLNLTLYTAVGPMY